MYEDITKALLSNSDNIIGAIDRYLAKVDEDLEEQLKKEGFLEEKDTVEQVNSLEEQISIALHSQTDNLINMLKEADQEGIDEEELQRRISQMITADVIATNVQQATLGMYEVQIPQLASVYMQESDQELVVDSLRERTSRWIENWSQRLGELTKINTHQQITLLIEDSISSGASIVNLTRKIQEGGWRNEYYQARRFALTEVLRAHSVAREEAIQQSPAVDQKEWMHTGSHKNKPRSNHVDMDGQIVPKDQSFVLKGRDGNTYYPMYPRDSSLPAAEAVNCHCIHRGIVNEDILGLSYEERKAMQEEVIENDNVAWQEEMNE